LAARARAPAGQRRAAGATRRLHRCRADPAGGSPSGPHRSAHGPGRRPVRHAAAGAAKPARRRPGLVRSVPRARCRPSS